MNIGKIKEMFFYTNWLVIILFVVCFGFVGQVSSKDNSFYQDSSLIKQKNLSFQTFNTNSLLTGCSSALGLLTGTPYYDNDCKTDVAIWRQGTNAEFWALGSYANNPIINQYGTNGDIPLAGDFDGDGVSDIAVYRVLTGNKGNWYILSSMNPNPIAAPIHFGTSPYDMPVLGKFENTGNSTNIAVFRMVIKEIEDRTVVVPTFYYKKSPFVKIELSEKPINQSDLVPVVSNYDDDGITDFAVWSKNNGRWNIKYSSTGVEQSVVFGVSGDVPVPGNYKNNAADNNRSDLAVWRQSTGTWWIYHTNNGEVQNIQFGSSGDQPVAGDYDGDGFMDIAVFRPSTGFFHILGSSVGYYTVQFGLAGDIPIALPTWSSVELFTGGPQVKCPTEICSKSCPEEGCS